MRQGHLRLVTKVCKSKRIQSQNPSERTNPAEAAVLLFAPCGEVAFAEAASQKEKMSKEIGMRSNLWVKRAARYLLSVLAEKS